MTTLDRSLFRAYDIRGVVDQSLTEDVVYQIGQALGSANLEQGQQAMIIARDGRLSGPKLLHALKEGLLATGCDVIDIGAVPTPVLYFATKKLATQSGVMLTGSHNPVNYNGLKMVLSGVTLASEAIMALYDRIVAQRFHKGQGNYSQHEVTESYYQAIAESIQLKKPLKVVVDAGNGIAGACAPKLLSRLGCEVTELFCEVDGSFPNHHPDPSKPQNLTTLINMVSEQGADLGLAFDGDGDRLGVVTEKGEIIWPDRQMMLYAKDVLSRNPNGKILFDVKCTRHLPRVIEQFGGKPIMWKTGHSLVKAKMHEEHALLAGEMSGHIFFQERWYGFDDALYTASRLLEICSYYDATLSEIFSAFPDSVNTPELNVAIADDQKFQFIEKLKAQTHFDNADVSFIDGMRVDFDDGWGLVRPSNTTPCLVLRFEAENEQSLQRIQQQFKKEMLAVDSNLTITF